jgi:hypothetical protein
MDKNDSLMGSTGEVLIVELDDRLEFSAIHPLAGDNCLGPGVGCSNSGSNCPGSGVWCSGSGNGCSWSGLGCG